MDRHTITQQTKRKGFNLIEAAIVLGVVGLVIGGIWAAASAVIEKYRVNETSEGLVTSCNRLSRLFPKWSARPIGNDGVNVTHTAIAAGVFPKSWIKGNEIHTPVGIIHSNRITQWDLDRGGPSIGGNVGIKIDVKNKSICKNLALSIAGRLSSSNGIISSLRLHANGTSVLYLDTAELAPENVNCGDTTSFEVVCITQNR
jgi:hypothetical protein